MIELAFDVVVGCGIMIGVAWILVQWGWRSVRQRAWPTSFDRSWMQQCSVCTYSFVDAWSNRFVRCPRCQSWIERHGVQDGQRLSEGGEQS